MQAQITAQQLVARAYNCDDALHGFAEAFITRRAPLRKWAAKLPGELRQLCCHEHLSHEVGAAAVSLRSCIRNHRGASRSVSRNIVHVTQLMLLISCFFIRAVCQATCCSRQGMVPVAQWLNETACNTGWCGFSWQHRYTRYQC
jgi:hypothetical protein